jgi:hypothetical protein
LVPVPGVDGVRSGIRFRQGTLVQAAARKVLEGGKALLKASPLTASTVKTIVEIVEKIVTFLGK